MSATDEMTAAAEQTWLDTWTAGPTEPEGSGLPAGAKAPDLGDAGDASAAALLAADIDNPVLQSLV
jgi:hypothetical protein